MTDNDLKDAIARHFAALGGSPEETAECVERCLRRLSLESVAGASVRDIAIRQRLAMRPVSKSTVHRMLNPKAKEVEREHRRKNREAYNLRMKLYMRKYRARKRQG